MWIPVLFHKNDITKRIWSQFNKDFIIYIIAAQKSKGSQMNIK